MTDNLIASPNKLISSLIKMTKWHAYVAHTAKHINMVGGPVWWEALGPPKSGAGQGLVAFLYSRC